MIKGLKTFTQEEVQSIKAVFNKYYNDDIFAELTPELIKTNEEMGFNENWAIYYGHTSHDIIFSNRDMDGDRKIFTEHFSHETTVAEFCEWLDDYIQKNEYA